MKLEYTGPLAAVEIAATGQTVKRGESVEVEGDLGRSLLEQGSSWETAAKAAKKAKTGSEKP